MPMSNADVPSGKPSKAQAPGTSPSPEPVAADPSLAPAAASSDPAVHRLLAEREIAVSNGDEKAAGAVTDALAELGYR